MYTCASSFVSIEDSKAKLEVGPVERHAVEGMKNYERKKLEIGSEVRNSTAGSSTDVDGCINHLQ